jgi:hypothetical protein
MHGSISVCSSLYRITPYKFCGWMCGGGACSHIGEFTFTEWSQFPELPVRVFSRGVDTIEGQQQSREEI